MDSASTEVRCQFCRSTAATVKGGGCTECSGSFVIHKVLVPGESNDAYFAICSASLYGGVSESMSCSTRLPERTVSTAVIHNKTEMNPGGLESQNELQGAVISTIDSPLHSSLQADRAARASATAVGNNETGATEPRLTGWGQS